MEIYLSPEEIPADLLEFFEPAYPDAKRDVWKISTQSFPEAHFATFPEKLVEPCILAGTSEKGCCPECGAPWERVVDQTIRYTQAIHNSKYDPGSGWAKSGWRAGVVESQTLGWQPTCSHEADPVPCTVLDPFVGSGTTCLVAMKLGRHSVGIDLSGKYIEMAQKRIGYTESLL